MEEQAVEGGITQWYYQYSFSIEMRLVAHSQHFNQIIMHSSGGVILKDKQ